MEDFKQTKKSHGVIVDVKIKLFQGYHLELAFVGYHNSLAR